MTLKGDAGFKYDPGTGLVTFALQFPLWRPAPARSKVRFSAWSLDRTAREVLTIGSGVAELRTAIRFESNGAGLLAMLTAGADGATLTYYPSLAAPATNYPAQLIEPDGETLAAGLDPERGPLGEYLVEIVLRRTDGGTFAGLF